jgi:hypothetical protein
VEGKRRRRKEKELQILSLNKNAGFGQKFLENVQRTQDNKTKIQ